MVASQIPKGSLQFDALYLLLFCCLLQSHLIPFICSVVKLDTLKKHIPNCFASDYFLREEDMYVSFTLGISCVEGRCMIK